MFNNGYITSWPQFLHALELHFAPTAYDDPRGKLFKLQQTDSVASYLSEFEYLANRIVGLSLHDLLSCFISGLKSEIRREVLAQQPSSLSQATGLARLQEEKFQDLLRLKKTRPSSSWQAPSTTRTISPFPAKSVSDSPPPKTIMPPLLPTPVPKTCYRQLSASELAERREKGFVSTATNAFPVITNAKLVFFF